MHKGGPHTIAISRFPARKPVGAQGPIRRPIIFAIGLRSGHASIRVVTAGVCSIRNVGDVFAAFVAERAVNAKGSPVEAQLRWNGFAPRPRPHGPTASESWFTICAGRLSKPL